jgi:Tfp pilus assembly protein PilF
MAPCARLLLALLCALSLAGAAAAADSAADLIARGMSLLEQGKLEPAREAFAAATRADPTSVEAHMRLAGACIAQNDFAAAIPVYRQAIGLDPNNAKAFIGLGIAYLHGGNKSLARAALEEAIRLEPGRETQLASVIATLNSPD